jgi:hypothetical protein
MRIPDPLEIFYQQQAAPIQKTRLPEFGARWEARLSAAVDRLRAALAALDRRSKGGVR